MPESLPLTFGIELEFVALYPRGAFMNQEPDLLPTSEEADGEITAGHALQYFLNKANVPATGWDESNSVPLPAHPPYSKWCVSEDWVNTTFDESEHVPENYIEEPIEIGSRILRQSGDHRGEIRTVLDVMAYMQSRFDARFITNETTGFHVHIGNDAGQPMPLDTVKRLFQVTTAHERVIDSLHASSRVLAPTLLAGNSPHIGLLYAPLSFFHRRADEDGDDDGPHIFEWLARIERMHTFKALSKFFERRYDDRPLSGHSSVVNFDNLWSEEDDDLKNTVEFRQHVGTLDYLEIVAWVTFLLTLVHFCHAASDREIMGLTLRATDDQFTAADLMRVIGCPGNIIQHYQFDEDAMIGMLPSSSSAIRPDPLAVLTDQNDEEVTDNTDRLGVKYLINYKLSSYYYGFSSALGVLPLEPAVLQDMLRRAYHKLHIRQLDRGDLSVRAKESQARQLVFISLSWMHRHYDPTLGPLQPAIMDGIVVVA